MIEFWAPHFFMPALPSALVAATKRAVACDRTWGSPRDNMGNKNGNYRLEIVLLRRGGRARLRITVGFGRVAGTAMRLLRLYRLQLHPGRPRTASTPKITTAIIDQTADMTSRGLCAPLTPTQNHKAPKPTAPAQIAKENPSAKTMP